MTDLLAKYNTFDMKALINLTNILYDPEVVITLNELRDGLSKGQILSKLWLVDELNKLDILNGLSIMILGGWIGTLSSFIFQHCRFTIDKISSVDIDPRCEKIANGLNIDHLNSGEFEAITRDMMTIDYEEFNPNVIINTSCEHIEDLPGWFNKIPNGKIVIAQSNNFFSCDQHVNCVNSVDELKAQLNFSKILFTGTLPFTIYDRYMIIGIK